MEENSSQGTTTLKAADLNKLSRFCLRTLCSLLVLTTTVGCNGPASEGDVLYLRSVSGRLSTPSGAPISGASIFVTDTQVEEVTDNRGEFAFRARLAGPTIEMRIKERGSDEVKFPIAIRSDQSSKVGLNIAKAGGAVDVLQGIDTALIPSNNCRQVFAQDLDLDQVAVTNDNCLVATSALLTGSQVGGIRIYSTATSCPREVDCPRDEVSTFEVGLTMDLPAGVDRDYCDYRIEYRNFKNELLQSIRINSNGSRLIRCK